MEHGPAPRPLRPFGLARGRGPACAFPFCQTFPFLHFVQRRVLAGLMHGLGAWQNPGAGPALGRAPAASPRVTHEHEVLASCTEARVPAPTQAVSISGTTPG